MLIILGSFHLELNWLGVTAALFDELRAKCSAQAERYGLRFVEAPVEQIKDISLKCAYRAPLQIRLALAPPVIPDLHLRLAEQHGTGQTANVFEYVILTQKFGFVLDVEASSRYPETIEVEYGYRKNSHYEYSQFCHRSGLALVQCIGGEEGFLWADNRLFIAAPSRGRTGDTYPNAPVVRMGKTEEARALREELEAFCADKVLRGGDIAACERVEGGWRGRRAGFGTPAGGDQGERYRGGRGARGEGQVMCDFARSVSAVSWIFRRDERFCIG
jgi:hypothetical protein